MSGVALGEVLVLELGDEDVGEDGDGQLMGSKWNASVLISFNVLSFVNGGVFGGVCNANTSFSPFRIYLLLLKLPLFFSQPSLSCMLAVSFCGGS